MCFCQDLAALLVLRFLSGAFAAAPLTNSGGVIADTFPPQERGLAMTVYALVPLFAPVLDPIIGGFVAGTRLALVDGDDWSFRFSCYLRPTHHCYSVSVLKESAI